MFFFSNLRDLKSDNILIELKDNCQPILVLSDFGCCLADKKHGLKMPYNSYDTDKGKIFNIINNKLNILLKKKFIK